jgi:murein DD-endopeptidase MepM/ murein hydrolase activator NlpD
MVIPHDPSGRTYSLKIPAFVVTGVVMLSLFSILVVGSSVVYSSLMTRRLVHYQQALVKNQQQQNIINNFANETEKVKQEIKEIVTEDNKLRQLLGLSSWQSKIKLSGSNETKSDKVANDLKLAKLQIAEKRESLEELKAWVKTVRDRFANTPSTWPIYGAVVSTFGYRTYPWRGMHTGIDIQASYGAPVRSTADGIVSYVGWRSGYGKTVMIDHGLGTVTLYGHNSGYAVAPGQKVRKGQVICYIGMTGYTTGPHCHYEVQRGGRKINPIAYLNLNVLSASKFWKE